jgi:hypothetical protein
MKKLNWGHGIVIAMALFMSFILFMVFVFPNGKQNAEMISDNYYEDEMQYQTVIDAKKSAEQLSELPAYSETQDGMKILFPSSIIPDNKEVSFSLFRINDKNLDINKSLVLDTSHGFSIPKSVITAGAYILKVKWKQDKKDFQVDYDIQWK